MLQSLKTPSLMEILPSSILGDEKIKAAATALDAELKRLSIDAQVVLHLPRLDELPHEVLDMLAWQYHVDFYSANFNIDTKREMIRETIFWHQIKGTPAAVEKLFSPFTKFTKVQENWEYGGEPFFFRIITQGLRDFGDDGKTFMNMIYEAKNCRSWLEEIIFDLTLEEPEIYFVAHEEGEGGKILTDIAKPTLPNDYLYHSANEIEIGYETINPQENSLNCFTKIFYVLLENEFGEEIIDCAYIPSSDDDFFFANLCKQKWLNFKNNPVIEFYHHNNHYFDGEIDCDEPEIFPLNEDFLRLYFDFPGSNRIRFLTFLNPRSDLTRSEINLLGSYAAQNNVLINSAGLSTRGVKRAFIVTKTIQKVV